MVYPNTQRWSALRKKDGSANPGSTVATVATNTQYTAEQLATRHSLNLALDMPFKKLTAPGVTDPGNCHLTLLSLIYFHINPIPEFASCIYLLFLSFLFHLKSLSNYRPSLRLTLCYVGSI